jgi:regulation of enolase protein 1 (concanavalin A-like superfamily)
MGIFTAIILLGVAIVLFVAARRRWIDNATLQTLANIAGVVALLAAIAVFVIPVPAPIGNSTITDQPTQTVVPNQASQISTFIQSTEAPNLAETQRPPTATSLPILPTITPTQLPPTPLSPTAISGPIPFSAPNEPSILNPVLGWQPGSSLANSYDLMYYPGALFLTAGTDTVQYAGYDDTAPYVTYNFEGDFDVQVKVVFSPSQDTQAASLGVRSVQNRNTWLRISRYHFGGQIVWVVGNRNGSELRLNSVSYASDTVHFKIERRRFLFTLSYSTNGSNWIDLQKEYVFEMPNDVEIFLSVYSIFNSEAVKAAFYDFVVVDR